MTDVAALPPKAILLGVTRHTQGLAGATDLSALGDDGFRLVTEGPHLLVVGSGVRGTLYGVYEVLERYGGCRWYASFFSRIPEKKTWTVPALDRTETPAFVMREPYWFDMFDGDFAARARSNGNQPNLRSKHGGKIRFGRKLFVHSFYRLMPPNEFFPEHPEYYSELDGKRQADHGQLCLSNPDVVRIVTERVLERIRKDPTAKLFSVSQNDWHGYCTCAKCRAIDEREGSPAGSMIAFVNKVAEAVQKEFPNVWIETLAYQYTRRPPKTIRPRHNVVPRLCSIECDFSSPLDVSPYKQNVSFVEDMKGWSAISDKLYVWDYTTNFRMYIGPHPNFAALQGNVKFFRDNRVVGLFEQGAYQSHHAEFAELRAWVLAKLLWNPDLDMEALYDDFFNGYYGPAAAKPIRTYFDELQALVAPPEHALRIFLNMNQKWYTDEFFERAAKRWQEAEKLASGTQYEKNVRMSAIPVWYARLERLHTPPARWTWTGRVLRNAVDDSRYVSLARELVTRIREGGITHAAENDHNNSTFMNKIHGCTEGFAPAMIGEAGLSAGIVPEVGGRVVVVRREAEPNVLHAAAGGIGFAANAHDLLGLDATAYKLARRGKGEATLHWDLHWRPYKLDRAVSLSDGGARVTTDIVNTRMQSQTFKPAIRVALDLGDATAVGLRVGDEPWVSLALAADQATGTLTLPGRHVAGRELRLASGRTGRTVALQVPNMPVERLFCILDSRSTAVRLLFIGERRELPANGRLPNTVVVRPAETTRDAPFLDLPSQLRNVFLAEDCLFRISKPGVWGDTVQDDRAGDGFAARLTNTHYEWCMAWRFDPTWFEKGVTYKLDVRARIDRVGGDGEAFWAGVYDDGRKKSQCFASRKTAEMRDGYAWYDVGEWTPEPDQYIWIGPGRFDLKGGATSAIGALHVDCFRLTKRP